ncbi:MAG: hypothetical protein KY445_16100, partial [Armatimonadetes bacterium]|nr:hypothetical protein [Armatimonadota bacterium]
MKRILALLTLFFFCAFAYAQTDLQSHADRAFTEKSYARALELYRRAKAAGAVHEPEKVDYQIAQSLFKTEKWDEAIASANFALKGASWKARFHYLLGQIYVKAPKQAWKLGDRVWRQDEYPAVQGDQKAQQVYLGEEDQKAALENFETAKIEAQKERDLAQRARFVAPIYPLGWDEENDLNFDLAAFLPQVQFEEFLKSLENRGDGKFDDIIDLKQPYARGWSMPKKVLFLYAEIRGLDQSQDRADFARSLLAEGLFLRAYQQRMQGWARKYDEQTKKVVVRPYPFDSSQPVPVWRRLVNELPQSPLAPQALLLIAQEHQNRNELIKAAATFRELIQKYPKSKLVSDARAALSQIEAREISFSLAEPTRPGKQPKFAVSTRNLKTIQFAAYKIKLEDFLTQKSRLSDPETQFTSFTQNFGAIAEARRKFGAPVTTWNYQSDDKGDHQGKNGQVNAPFSALGAYAVIAEARGKRFAQLVLISDLALLKKSDKDGSFVYVADAKSGAPIQNANVVLKEVWNWNPRRVDVAQGQSND